MTLVSGDEFETFAPAATLLAEHGRTAEAVSFLHDRVKAVPWDSAAKLQLARLLSGDERRNVALGLIQDGDAVYPIRASAARLAPEPAADSSSELGLLQHGKITPNEASKPFYVEARKVAGLLREALAIHPSDDQLRLETLRSALAAKQDSVAIALASHLRIDEGFPSTFGLGEPARAEIARDVAQAYEREGDVGGAITFTNIAIRLGLDLEATKKQLEAEQSRVMENARRAPQIHEHLEQEHVVGPRLPGRAI
jgi:hypothetical protein